MASGKRLKSGYELIDRNKTYTVDEAAKIIKEAAKAKFDVYPSAYANGWAAKQYKAAGGTWRSAK